MFFNAELYHNSAASLIRPRKQNTDAAGQPEGGLKVARSAHQNHSIKTTDGAQGRKGVAFKYGIMCGMKRRIPYGVINWENLVNECYVVDNTSYIRELENCKTPVLLRPKRFGKSIVCSMLEY